MLKKVIGIISYMPDDPELRKNRLEKCLKLFEDLNEHFRLPIILIAQNWNIDDIKQLTKYTNQKITIHTYQKLGITKARQILRQYFLESEYDYIILCDDDSELKIGEGGVAHYLNEIDEHPDKLGLFFNGFPRLMAVSKAVYKKLGYDYIINLEAERGEVWEDHCWNIVQKRIWPEDRFQFSKYNLDETSLYSEHDPNSTWYPEDWKQLNDDEKWIKNREMLKKCIVIIALWEKKVRGQL